MRKYGLVGYPLEHSFSAKYFAEKFVLNKIDDAEYDLFPIANIEELPSFIKNDNDLHGFNVTIPYKETIIPFLDDVDPEAEKVGAVNVVKIFRDSGEIRKVGFNTDVIGFRKSIYPFLKANMKKALILGTGGGAKAVAYGLMRNGIESHFVSRYPEFDDDFSYTDLNEEIINNHKIIINCTPLGTFPKENTYPDIPYQFIGSDHLLFDLVYNPSETLFMLKGKQNGAVVVNGYEMLRLQADEAWAIWNM